MKKTIIFLLLPILLLSCDSYYNKIHHEYDDYKKEEKIYLAFQKEAKSLSKRNKIPTNLLWRKIKGEQQNTTSLYLTFPYLNLDAEVSNEFFIKTDDDIVKVNFDKIKNTSYHHKDSSQETKIIKEKDKNDKEKEIITHTTDSYDREFQKTKVQYIIPESLQNKILKTNQLSIRFYINTEAYTLKMNQNQLNKTKDFFRQNSNSQIASIRQ